MAAKAASKEGVGAADKEGERRAAFSAAVSIKRLAKSLRVFLYVWTVGTAAYVEAMSRPDASVASAALAAS